MNFNQFVVRNTMRNKHLYLAYFLSTLFSVMIFFTFSVFAFHPQLKADLNQQVQTGMLGAAIIIYGFAFFFVLYSMGTFLQSRKKEFGLLMIQGMSPRQLRKMVFIENLVIGFFATIFGSLLGIGFSQGILWIAEKLIRVNLGFYFPAEALGLTLLSFILLFFAISIVIQFRLPKLRVQELLKAGELGKGNLKTSKIKSILAALLILGGYGVALLVPGGMVWLVFLPVVFVVILGTRFLFNQLSVFLIEKLKKRKAIFWKKTNMVVFSDLSFRMKDNARSFFLVSVISTVAFAAIGTLYGVQSLLTSELNAVPYQFSALTDDPAIIQQVDTALKDNEIAAEKVAFTYYYDAQPKQLIHESAYNQLAQAAGEKPVSVGNGVAQIPSEQMGTNATQTATSVEVSGQNYPIEEVVTTQLLPTYSTSYIVPDNIPLTNYTPTENVYWFVTAGSRDQQIAAGKALSDQHVVGAQEYTKDMMLKGYASILFVGIFIGIVFFVSAGSFLYFRLYSDLDADIEKFSMIYKIGLSKNELKKMIHQQVGILFFTPIVVSFAHGAVALTAMYHMFGRGMQLAGWQVLAVFVLIQLVYYLIARSFYFRKVYQAIQHS